VANASAASVFFRVSASAFSVKFRVIPWQKLDSYSSFNSYFREIPCHSVANSSAFACSYFREIPCPSVAIFFFPTT
jgi:hypothetical protein